MSITSVTSHVPSTAVVAVKAADMQPAITGKNESTISSLKSGDNKQNTEMTADNNQTSESQCKKVTEELNNFMQSMNTDIKFVFHNRTDTLMIQVEDGKTHRVLKEFPAHELLDMVAKMKDDVGALVDQKA